MSAPIIASTDVVVHVNDSVLDDRTVIHKARDHGFQTGFHRILVQDRYGDGAFFFDWAPCGGPDDYSPRDWNVVIQVK